MNLYPTTGEIYLPKGEVPDIGDLLINGDFAKMLKVIVSEEKSSANKGRIAGIEAGCNAFYKGPIAKTILDFIETQDALIHQTKKQCALVEVKSTTKGVQSFDLPSHLKRSTSVNRARKDNYTTLMLSNWATRSYFDIINLKEENVNNTFVPMMI